MASSPSDSRACRIDKSLGRDRICPEGECPFWEARGDSSTGRCVFEEVDLAGRSDLVHWLAGLRDALAAGSWAPRDEARRAFYERLNAGGDA